MADTYSQLYIHYVFAVQNRISLIQTEWKEALYLYMIGIVENHDHRLYSINGTSNHLHLLVSMNPKQSPSDLMYHLKRGSSLWVNNEQLVPGKFSWQEGFGAFSYGKSQIPKLIHYIQTQELHHQKQTFKEEYEQFLKLFEIEYDPRYILKEIE
jgi:REP element-mobilizing transposase RayT